MLQLAAVALRRRALVGTLSNAAAGAAAAVGGTRRLGSLASLAHHTTQQHQQQQQQQQSLKGNMVWSRTFHASASSRMMAEVVMTVPSMGDSITEGTIKSWEKKVGDAVAVDEVVVVIETDKVSVDIRAKDAGVLVEQFAAVDDNVEVGAKLLKIDTAASASASASSPSPAKTAPPPPPPPPPPSAAATAAPPPPTPAAPPAPTTASEPHRKPLIKFLGKRSLIGKGGSPAAAPPSKATGPAPVRYEDLKSTPGAKTFGEMPAMFGRPALSQKEIDAIESGGATL